MGRGQIIAIAATIIIAALVYTSARYPEAEVVEAPATENNIPANSSLDEKVNQAVAIIQNGGESPMEAIMLLREVITEEPNHVEANYWLGVFSMMSNQHEKAIQRFETVLKVDPDNVDACIKLAEAMKVLGMEKEAIDLLNAFKSAHPLKELIEQIDTALEEMNVKS